MVTSRISQSISIMLLIDTIIKDHWINVLSLNKLYVQPVNMKIYFPKIKTKNIKTFVSTNVSLLKIKYLKLRNVKNFRNS